MTRRIHRKRREAVLLVGNFRAALALARPLSKAGYRVITMLSSFSAICLSRHVHDVWWRDSDFSDLPKFVEDLEQYLSSNPDIIGVAPLYQDLIVALLPYRDRLSVPLLVSNSEPVSISDDKARLSQLGSELGLSVAPFAVGNGVQELIEACNNVGYPCVFKSKNSLGPRLPILILRNEEQVRSVAKRLSGKCKNFMVQQLVGGWRCNRYFIAFRGRVLRHLDIKILRTARIDDTGLMVSAISVAPLAKLDEPTARLIEALDYSGVGNVQFLVDDSSGENWLLEVNPLTGSSYAFPDYCGGDLGSALVDIVQNRPLDRWSGAFSYPIGKRFAWLMGDIGGLLWSIERRQVTPRQALHWLVRALASGIRADCHSNWAWDDPLPALYLYGRRMTLFALRALHAVPRIALRRSMNILTGGRRLPTRR